MWVALLVASAAHAATTCEVGPGKVLASVGDVPWEALGPGDTVLIYACPMPYREWCALFGGRVRKDCGTDPPIVGGRGQFNATDAPVPAACPLAPGACP